MENLQIETTLRKKDYEEIYYSGNDKNIFHFLKRKKIFVWFSIAIILTIFFYLLSFLYPVISWLILVGLFSIGICVIKISISATKYYSWKNNIENSLQEYLIAKPCLINLNDNSIEFVTDNVSQIEKWEHIKSIKTADNYISMATNKENYLLPANSMQPEDFEKLKHFIKEKIK